MVTPTQMKPRPAAPSQKQLRAALVCDPLEEGWYSMDLFGDMLASCFQQAHAGALHVEQLRPRLNARFSALPIGASRNLRNLDRFLHRFVDYPRWLSGQVSRFDLFHIVDHSYSQLALALPPGRTVVTCHDLDTFRCILDPGAEPRPKWFQAMARRTLRGFLLAAHVICVSAFTKEQLLRHGLFTEDRLSVIPPGVDPVFFSDPSAEPGTITAAKGPYLLHVGSTIRRKRMDVLLRVFAEVLKEFPDLHLIQAGGALTPEQSALAASLQLSGKIVQAPGLSKAQLAALYRDATLLLQTSEAEGFGLPVIEAMACGCPVVASDIAPLREAGGDAADYCPVGDINIWSATVARLLRERRDAPEAWEVRRTLARRHAGDFTWSKNAARTLAVYDRVFRSG